MQVWICIKNFLAIVCTKEGEIVRKGRIKTNEKEIREFFSRTKECKGSYRSIYKTIVTL